MGYRQSSACPCAQILLQAAGCSLVGDASWLSAEFTWRQLVPDFAALARSICVALEAWPREVPKPALFMEGEVKLHGPLGLQLTVRPSLSACSLRAPSLALGAPPPGQCFPRRGTSRLLDDDA